MESRKESKERILQLETALKTLQSKVEQLEEKTAVKQLEESTVELIKEDDAAEEYKSKEEIETDADGNEFGRAIKKSEASEGATSKDIQGATKESVNIDNMTIKPRSSMETKKGTMKGRIGAWAVKFRSATRLTFGWGGRCPAPAQGNETGVEGNAGLTQATQAPPIVCVGNGINIDAGLKAATKPPPIMND
jgi:hypothetical protein